MPPAEAEQRLREFGWDSDEQLVTLRRADVQRVLDQYLLENLSAKALELWANAIEGRDDIGFEDGFEGAIKHTVFQLRKSRDNGRAHRVRGTGVEEWVGIDVKSLEIRTSLRIGARPTLSLRSLGSVFALASLLVAPTAWLPTASHPGHEPRSRGFPE